MGRRIRRESGEQGAFFIVDVEEGGFGLITGIPLLLLHGREQLCRAKSILLLVPAHNLHELPREIEAARTAFKVCNGNQALEPLFQLEVLARPAKTHEVMASFPRMRKEITTLETASLCVRPVNPSWDALAKAALQLRLQHPAILISGGSLKAERIANFLPQLVGCRTAVMLSCRPC